MPVARWAAIATAELVALVSKISQAHEEPRITQPFEPTRHAHAGKDGKDGHGHSQFLHWATRPGDILLTMIWPGVASGLERHLQ